MLKGKLICPCQITPRSFFGPTDVKPAASLFTLPGKSSRELPFSFHKTQSSIALLLLLSLPFRRSSQDHKISTALLPGSVRNSSGDSLCASPRRLSPALEPWCCGRAGVSSSPLGPLFPEQFMNRPSSTTDGSSSLLFAKH